MDVEDGVSVSGGTACQSVSQSVNGVWSTMDVEPVSAPSSPMSTEEAPSAEEMTSRAEPHLLGIDEAGRGPVLGPMVYGTAWCPISRKEEMSKLGFMDSKVLTPKGRDELLDVMDATPYLHWDVDILTPEFISEKMLQRDRYSLNAMSHDSAIGLIRKAISQGFNIREVYVDTVGDANRYEQKLSTLFPGVACTVRPKADRDFPIVSAASIGAKVTRDRSLDKWVGCPKEVLWDGPKGCGYPGDEKTKTWLRKNTHEFWGPPLLARFSWAPTRKIMEENGVHVDYVPDEEDEENEAMANSHGGGIRTFFGGGGGGPPAGSTTKYFSSRGMTTTTAQW